MMRLHDIRLARPADQDFSDLTSAVLTGPPAWVPDQTDVLDLPFDKAVTAAQKLRIRRRLVTADTAEEARVTTYAESRVALRALTGLTGVDAIVVPVLIAMLDERLARYGE
jgi:hypothetical protein